MIKAIIFDCFGVLITDALQLVRDKHALTDPNGAKEIKSIISAANLGILPREESNKLTADILGITVDEYRSRISAGEVRNEELFAYILELRNTFKTALLSNIPQDSLYRRFKSDELALYFDVVVTSGEVGFAKPSPEIYEITAGRLGFRCDECVFVDDRDMFVEAARGVGMNAFVYTDFQAFRTKLSELLK